MVVNENANSKKKNEVSPVGSSENDQVNIEGIKYVMSLPERKFYLKANREDVEDNKIFHLKISIVIVIIVLNPL